MKGETEAERSGHAPVDFTFRGNAYLLDEEFNAYRMEIEYSDFGSYLSVFDMKAKVLIEEDDMPVYDEGEELDYSDVPFELSETSGEEEEIESYEALDETSDSAFFRHVLSLDQQIDKKVTETLAYVDDTRNLCRRYGSKIVKKHKYIYVEFFNTHNAAERQYLQIIKRDDGEILYTASHVDRSVGYIIDATSVNHYCFEQFGQIQAGACDEMISEGVRELFDEINTN